MIKISQLSKQFDDFLAVKELSFEVQPGEVLGFLGPNGAGKSTTMKMITGFLKPTSGSVELYGKDILNAALDAKRLIGYLPEGAPCYGDMTVKEFLDFVAEVRGYRTKQSREERVSVVVEKLQLKKVLYRPIEALSKGFKRRVGLAQAILHDPKVLVLDEPTDGLDPNQKHQVRELIKGLSKDKIVIISTHILEEVVAVCTRAVIIANGKLVADGTPEHLEAQSRHHNAVTLEVDVGDSSIEPADYLAQLDVVEAVEVEHDSDNKITLIPKGGEEIYDRVGQVIKEQGWQVKQLYIERGRLDEVFRNITQEVA